MGSVVIIVSTIMILSIIINYFLIDDAEKEIDLKLDTLLVSLKVWKGLLEL